MRSLNAAQWWKNDWGHLCWSFDKIRGQCYPFSPNLLAGSDKCARTRNSRGKLIFIPDMQNRKQHKQKEAVSKKKRKKINRCWFGLLSTFILHGRQQAPFFSGPGNQYCDLWLGWASHHTEQRKRAGHANWLWNESEKSPVCDRWLKNRIAQAQVPGTPIWVHAYSTDAARVFELQSFPNQLLSCEPTSMQYTWVEYT